jgi:hypothetical protein
VLVVGKVEHMETIPICTTLDFDNLRDRGYLNGLKILCMQLYMEKEI